MAEQRPADTRIEGAANDAAIKGMTPAIETIEAFSREIALMSWQAFVRTIWHIDKLREADRMEEAAAIQADWLKESMEHAVQHTRKYIEMLATFPHGLVQPVSVAVAAAEAAWYANAAKVERLSEVAPKA
jgi:hypothetical protein